MNAEENATRSRTTQFKIKTAKNDYREVHNREKRLMFKKTKKATLKNRVTTKCSGHTYILCVDFKAIYATIMMQTIVIVASKLLTDEKILAWEEMSRKSCSVTN
jgi:hypothetical protein